MFNMEFEKLKVSDFARPYTKVSKDELIQQAFLLLEGRKETHLVVYEDRPIGIVSYKDFLRILSDRLRRRSLSKLYVSSLMTEKLRIIDADASIVEAAQKMDFWGISSLLVKEKGKVTKIITKKDILSKVDLFPDFEVKFLMTENPKVVSSGSSLNYAESLIRDYKISTLPVVENDSLVGYLDIYIFTAFLMDVLTNPDIKHPQRLLKEVVVGDIMKGPFFVTPETTVREFGKEIVKKKYKGAPVVISEQNKRVIGIITETDFIKFLAGKKQIGEK